MSTTSQVTDNRIQELAVELSRVLKSPLGEVYKDPRKLHETKFEHLTPIVRRLKSELWEEDPTWALLVVMRKAVKGLSDEKPEGSAIGWRELGEFLCGFSDKVPERSDRGRHTYQDYYDAARLAAGLTHVSKDKFKKEITRPLRRHLAAAILQLKPEGFSAEIISIPRQTTGAPTFAPPLVHIVSPAPVQPERPVERNVPSRRLRRIAQVRLIFGVVSLVLIGAVLGWFVAPRLYQPSQVWEGPFRGPSVFVVSSFRSLALVVSVAVVIVIWLLTSALVNWRPLSRLRAVLCMSFGLVTLAPVYLVGAVEFAHDREVGESSALPRLGSDVAFLYQNDNFDRVNNPNDYTAACTDNPVTYTPVGAGSPTAVLEGDLNPELCDEFNGVLTLYTWGSINAYDGDEREGLNRDFYVETRFRPSGFVLWAGCSISIVPVNDTATSWNFTLDVAQDAPVLYRALVVEYKNRGGEQESVRVQQRGSLVIPTKVGGDEFDQSPREGWLKLGVLRRGAEYKLFINDHLMLTHAREGSSELVRVQVEAHGNPHKGIGYAGCQFDYLRQWMFKD